MNQSSEWVIGNCEVLPWITNYCTCQIKKVLKPPQGGEFWYSFCLMSNFLWRITNKTRSRNSGWWGRGGRLPCFNPLLVHFSECLQRQWCGRYLYPKAVPVKGRGFINVAATFSFRGIWVDERSSWIFTHISPVGRGSINFSTSEIPWGYRGSLHCPLVKPVSAVGPLAFPITAASQITNS